MFKGILNFCDLSSLSSVFVLMSMTLLNFLRFYFTQTKPGYSASENGLKTLYFHQV